jgi:hypothetical protein
MEYCGQCSVCDEPVDHKDAGFCEICGSAFHWGDCGEWGIDYYGDSYDDIHMCHNCNETQ